MLCLNRSWQSPLGLLGTLRLLPAWLFRKLCHYRLASFHAGMVSWVLASNFFSGAGAWPRCWLFFNHIHDGHSRNHELWPIKMFWLCDLWKRWTSGFKFSQVQQHPASGKSENLYWGSHRCPSEKIWWWQLKWGNGRRQCFLLERKRTESWPPAHDTGYKPLVLLKRRMRGIHTLCVSSTSIFLWPTFPQEWKLLDILKSLFASGISKWGSHRNFWCFQVHAISSICQKQS